MAALTGISDKAVGDWRCILSNAVANWFLNNSTPLGGPGKIVEVDEAKFGKRKYNKGAYREGMWVLGGVDRDKVFLCGKLGKPASLQAIFSIFYGSEENTKTEDFFGGGGGGGGG